MLFPGNSHAAGLSVVDLKPCYGPVTSWWFCAPPLKKW
jgi:hypothetical protein